MSTATDAFFAPGTTFVIPFGNVGTYPAAPGCTPGSCAALPSLISVVGNLVCLPSDAMTAHWNLGNVGTLTAMPVQATFTPLWPSGKVLLPANLVGLPASSITALEAINDLGAPGPNAGPSTEFQVALPPGTYQRVLAPIAPFDAAYPPDVQTVTYGASSVSSESVAYGGFDKINTSRGPQVPTFDLLRADGSPLDGWTAYLQDATTYVRISNAAHLSGTEDKVVQLLTSHQPTTHDALENAALVMQPPAGEPLPTVTFPVVNDLLGPRVPYPALPPPVTVSGVVTAKSGGRPVPADIVFEATGVCRSPAGTGPDTSGNLVFSTIVSADEGKYSATLPLGNYRVTVRPRDAQTQVTVLAPFTLASNTCAPMAAPPIQLDVQRVVNGTAMVADGRPLSDATVELVPTACTDSTTGPECLPRATVTVTRDDGSFAFEADAGTYDLRVRPAVGSNLPWVVTPINIGPQPTVTLPPIAIPAPVYAGIQLQDPQGNPIVEALVRMYQTPANGPPVEIGEAVTDATGHYDMYLEPSPQ